jgi:hypothetical protein
MRVRGDGQVIAGYRGSDVRTRGVIASPTKPLGLAELGQLLDFFATGHDHGADPVPRTVPAP